MYSNIYEAKQNKVLKCSFRRMSYLWTFKYTTRSYKIVKRIQNQLIKVTHITKWNYFDTATIYMQHLANILFVIIFLAGLVLRKLFCRIPLKHLQQLVVKATTFGKTPNVEHHFNLWHLTHLHIRERITAIVCPVVCNIIEIRLIQWLRRTFCLGVT